MSASRKLYQKMAERYKTHRPLRGTNEYLTWRILVLVTANVFREDNSGFDVRRFLVACGYTAEDVADVFMPV